MINYSKIDIGSAWKEIQDYVLTSVVPDCPNPLVSKVFEQKDKDFMLFVFNALQKPLRENGFGVMLPKGGILFGNDPGAVMGIHIDGYSMDRKNASNFAINIPILNCEQGYMNWYSGAYELTETKTKEGLKHLKINWKEEPVIAERAIIDSPTIVRVNIPHNVENLSDKRRLMLSIRYVPDLALLNQ